MRLKLLINNLLLIILIPITTVCSLIEKEVSPLDLEVTYNSHEAYNILHESVERYVLEAQKRGITFTSPKVHIKLEEFQEEDVNGYGSAIKRQVRINAKTKKLDQEGSKYQLVAHELTHCLVQGIHSDRPHHAHGLVDCFKYSEYKRYGVTMMAEMSHNYQFPEDFSNEYDEYWEYANDEMFGLTPMLSKNDEL